MIKALLGYDLPPDLSEADHMTWLKEIHFKDMARTPGLDGIVLNRIDWVISGDDAPGYVAELHYPSLEAYRAARDWLKNNPFPPESQPDGRMIIRFFVICSSEQLQPHH